MASNEPSVGVLIIDDDEVDRASLRCLLGERFRVVEAVYLGRIWHRGGGMPGSREGVSDL